MKRLTKYSIAALAAAGAVSCSSEVQVDEPVKGQTDGVAEMQFSVQTPEMVTTRATTYNANYDDAIYDLGVLVMTDANSDTVWEFAYGTPLVGSAGNFKGKLTPSDEPVKLLFMANVATDGLMNALPAVGTPEAALIQSMVVDRSGGFAAEDDRMPMYGSVMLASISDISNTPVGVTLSRSAAKIHITKNLSADSGTFVMTSVAVYDYSTAVQVFPAPSNVNASGEITTASVPAVMPAYPGPFTAVTVSDYGTGLVFSRTLITPESSARAGNPARIVIGGYFNATGESFYRIDFEPTNNNPGKVIRNREYVFNITSVLGAGYATADQAAAADANSTVIDGTWYDTFERMWFSTATGDGATMGATSIDVAQAKGSVSAPVLIESSKPFIWWVDNSNAPDSQTTQSNDVVTVSAAPGEGASANSTTMVVVALTENNTGAPRTGKIYFSFLDGSVGGSITWTQIN